MIPSRTLLVVLLLIGVAPAARAQAVADAPTLTILSDSLEDLAVRVAPSVVQVYAVGYGPPQGVAATSGGLVPRRRGTGSGVIVDARGYIVTNLHVVDGAERIQVELSPAVETAAERRSILKGRGPILGAQVVGVDRETDLAVLKVQRSSLPVLPFGDSDELRPGQIVLAFGSPLGLENSVTLGVVSSVARQLEPDAPMIYIQTDATINPGNSGGPLVDTEGRLVGINTLIYTQSGGSEGIGFAAPSNIVRTVYEQIARSGRVRRGTIGVRAQTVTPLLARGLGLGQSWGVIAGDVLPGSPADLAGLLPGDLILALDGKTMENGRQLDVNLYRRTVGDVVTLSVLRGGDRIEKRVPVVERSDDPLRFRDLVDPDRNLVPELGILVIEIDDRVRGMLPPLRRDGGLLVGAEAADAPGWEEGFASGDVIYALNGAAVRSLADLRAALGALDAGDAVAVHLERGGALRYLVLELE